MSDHDLFIKDRGVFMDIEGTDVFVTDDPQVMEQVAREQDDWDEFVDPGKYAKTTSVPRSVPDADRPEHVEYDSRHHHCLLALQDFHEQMDDPRRKEEIHSQNLIEYGDLRKRVADVHHAQATIRKALSTLFHEKRLVNKTQRGQKAYYSLADAGVLELENVQTFGDAEEITVTYELDGIEADW